MRKGRLGGSGKTLKILKSGQFGLSWLGWVEGGRASRDVEERKHYLAPDLSTYLRILPAIGRRKEKLHVAIVPST